MVRILIQNFLIESKQNWKNIIWWLIIGFLITHFALEPSITFIEEKIGPKPNIIANVAIYKNLEWEKNNFLISSPLFGLWNENYFSLYSLNAKDKILSDWSMLNLQGFPYCLDCKSYNFKITNIGKKTANKIVMDIHSSNFSDITISDPKITHGECGGMYNKCRIIFEDILVNDVIDFEIVSKRDDELIISNCSVNDKYSCEIRFIEIMTTSILFPENKIMTIGDKVLKYPDKNKFGTNTLFYYNMNENAWIPLTTNNYNVVEELTLNEFLNRTLSRR